MTVVDVHAHVVVPGLGADVRWDERGQVLQYPSHKSSAQFGQPECSRGVIHRVAVAVPQAHMDVAAAARLIGEWLGRERGGQSVLQGDRAYGFAHGDLSVGRLEHRCVLNG